MRPARCLSALTVCVLLVSPTAWAWGGRGHHVICNAAAFLVEEPGMREFLRHRPHVMGYLCNAPDVHWKALGGEAVKFGSPTHWIDPEVIGKKHSEISRDYQSLIEKYTGKPNRWDKDLKKTITSVPGQLGSLWWRTQQFFDLAVADGKVAKKSPPPTDHKSEQDDRLIYNQKVFGFMVNLGLMGHFVGDASQPYHTTADHDGYGSGHGGIHSYYEEAAVSAQDETFDQDVLKSGRELLAQWRGKDKAKRSEWAFLGKSDAFEKVRALTELSFADIGAVAGLDPKTNVSSWSLEGETIKRTPAERPDANVVAGKLRPLLIKHFARSAALLAALWEDAYVKAGRPNLKPYRSWRFPATPDFVMPNYYKIETKTATP